MLPCVRKMRFIIKSCVAKSEWYSEITILVSTGLARVSLNVGGGCEGMHACRLISPIPSITIFVCPSISVYLTH